MEYRNLCFSLIGKLENINRNLNQCVSRQEPLETYLKYLETSKEIIEELSSVIEREPMTPNELNKFKKL